MWKMAAEGAHQFHMYHDTVHGELSYVVTIPSLPDFEAGGTITAISPTTFKGEASQRYKRDGCEEVFGVQIEATDSSMHLHVTAPATPTCGVSPDFVLDYDIVRSDQP